MAQPATRPSDTLNEYHAEIRRDEDELGRFLAPALAGARARGVADAFELMEIGVVLMDGGGRVLHAGGRAQRAMLPLIKVVEGHLVGSSPETNERLQAIVARAIGAGPSIGCPKMTFTDTAGTVRLTMTAKAFPHDAMPGAQLVQGLLIIG